MCSLCPHALHGYRIYNTMRLQSSRTGGAIFVSYTVAWRRPLEVGGTLGCQDTFTPNNTSKPNTTLVVRYA